MTGPSGIPWIPENDPRHVACPACRAEEGARCTDIATGQPIETPHVARVRAMEAAHPQEEERG